MHYFKKICFVIFISILLYGCTKYVNSNSSTSSSSSSSSSSGNTGSTPLNGGSSGSSSSGSSGLGSSSGSSSGGSSSSGSGSSSGTGSSSGSGSGSSSGGSSGSGSGSSSGSGTGSGSSSGGSTTSNAKTELQILDYTNGDNTYKFFADSLELKKNGGFNTINAKNVKITLQYKGSNTFTLGTFNLAENASYCAVFYHKANGAIDGTIIQNATTAPGVNKALIRFININSRYQDYLNFSFESYMDTVRSFNRKYLDHVQDTTLTFFRTVYSTTGYINIKNSSNQMISSYQIPFNQQKIYSVFSLYDPLSQTDKIMIGWHN